MDIPLKIRLPIQLKSLIGFRVIRFQDNKLTYPAPHWYILIRITGTDNFIIVIITSRRKKRIAYYKSTPKPKAAQCLVKISNDDFSFLSKDSAVNCNEAEYLSIKEIVHRIDESEGFKVEKEKVEAYLRKDIVSAIDKSPLVPPFIKNLAKASNPI